MTRLRKLLVLPALAGCLVFAGCGAHGPTIAQQVNAVCRSNGGPVKIDHEDTFGGRVYTVRCKDSTVRIVE